ncbi:MAG: hypothetical protein AB7P03_23610 [Kofleriaceae bacterium]
MRPQLPLALLLASTAAACVDPASDETQDVLSALEQPNGGFDTEDEAPMFGETELYASAEIEADAAIEDPMVSDPGLLEMQAAVDVSVRNVMIVWGQLPADPNATDARDWSGELRLSRGGMVLRRRIAFEDATDRLLPRVSRDAISFESRTRPFADGLALRVIDPAASSADPLTLTYTPADASAAVTFDLAQLAAGPLVVDVGGGNRIIVSGVRERDACDHGFMRGRWRQLRPNLGVYLGVVANADGEPVGHIRGVYGHRRSGEAVMYGKFINREGQFVGLLKGSYEDGAFQARWLVRAGDHGTIHGIYFPSEAPRGGGFMARWSETSCSEDQ